ncbi:MAG: BamA/TamA family outer membrane protein [Planctomycetes bacterium]|nr:BamA/TamA family outer membrane protein [Planctomycetota bacterium]
MVKPWNLWFVPALALLAVSGTLTAGEPPAWLPRYDLDIVLDPAQRLAKVKQRVTWTNRHQRPAREIVFNAHLHYSIPDKDVGLLAKMVEILRMAPSEAMSFDGPALDIRQVTLLGAVPKDSTQSVAARVPTRSVGTRFQYAEDNPTALVVALPEPVGPGESVTLELSYDVHIPAKKGRWGQWAGVTTLAQWVPVVAVYSEKGWDPAPFIPWHQPFHNEAGIYKVRVVLPKEQKLACSAAVAKERDLEDGKKELILAPTCLRDFAMIASDRFEEHTGKAQGVDIRVLALPQHEFYAKEAVKIISECLPVYNRWFGAYPYPQFTLVESYFGWNGNECGGLVMIDERMFNMPHMARAYLDYLISHEFCHQWWYNAVGTNGYAESFMDEGLATYFSHRIINEKLGKENMLLALPAGLEWLPNIRRDDFRNYGLIGVRARGEIFPTVQEMPKFKHLVNLSAYAYDRGSRIIGMIEERLGEKAFLEFTRHTYAKYQFQIMRVADYQKELELYTGRSWEDFFQHWVYGSGMCDWSVERVEMDGKLRPRVCLPRHRGKNTVKTVVLLKQQGGFNEPTVLGFSFKDGDGYPLRVPIIPNAPLLELDELGARVHSHASDDCKEATVRVEIDLPCEPVQITVDPDHVLLDQKPTNNHWKPVIRYRLTPLYTQLEETDVTNSYDRWNVIAGPWLFASAYSDPWFQRTPIAGAKIGVYRTQEFAGGAFIGYRANDRNIVAGVDGVWDHVPLPNTQVGFVLERSLAALSNGDPSCSRGVVYGRYILLNSSSLYLPPFEYVEVFGDIQNRCLPDPIVTLPGANPFNQRTSLGIHYHKNLMTPYWDAEAGLSLDVSYQYGIPIFGNNEQFHQVYGQVAMVKNTPDWLVPFHHPIGDWLRETRWAFRLGGAAALPNNGEFFALGGGDQFRGFDQQQRQGSLVWVGSVEWRVPIFKDVCWDFCDHVGGVRNVYIAPFYDIGDAYVNHQSYGPVAHAFGAGLRIDFAWLGLIERTILRFDVAKTINVNSPVQFWFGVQHPF